MNLGGREFLTNLSLHFSYHGIFQPSNVTHNTQSTSRLPPSYSELSQPGPSNGSSNVCFTTITFIVIFCKNVKNNNSQTFIYRASRGKKKVHGLEKTLFIEAQYIEVRCTPVPTQYEFCCNYNDMY